VPSKQQKTSLDIIESIAIHLSLLFTKNYIGRQKIQFKGRVHCFSMQVVMNKCFLLKTEKKFGADPPCRLREKRKIAPLNPKNDVTEPKVRLLYCNNQL